MTVQCLACDRFTLRGASLAKHGFGTCAGRPVWENYSVVPVVVVLAPLDNNPDNHPPRPDPVTKFWNASCCPFRNVVLYWKVFCKT